MYHIRSIFFRVNTFETQRFYINYSNMIYITIISIIVFAVSGETHDEVDMKCTKEYCRNFITEKGCPILSIDCLAMNSTHHGIYLKYPEVCNCCDYCLPYLAQGEHCMQGYPGLLPISISVCGDELSCTANDISTCERMTSDCTEAQDSWDERRQDGNLGMTEVRPRCDSDGAFTPFHCVPGSICYCVAPSGKRMFGEAPFLDSWNEQTMTCGCALNDWKMRHTLDVERWNEANSTGVFSARCTPDGHYDQLQCMFGDGGKCFCVNPVTGRPTEDISMGVNLTDIREGHPSCFNPSIHEPGRYDAPCESMRMTSNKSPDVALDDPKCQPDGMFHRLQTVGSKIICVDPSGRQIAINGVEYGANVDTHPAKNMNCNCARNVWLLAKFGSTELPKCCSNGNFESWQCRRNLCYCVDNDGNQYGLEVSCDDISKLLCYNGGTPCSL